MANLFKKAASFFVEVEAEKQTPAAKPAETEPTTEAAAVTGADASNADAIHAELSQDPDVARTAQATQLLTTLDLEAIPADKARELILKTLAFAGLKPEELITSFRRARSLYQAAIQSERDAAAARQAQHDERIKLLESAMAEEKKQFADEISTRESRVQQATGQLTAIEKAMGFFATEEQKQS
ncbi:MAG: hypothetical protein ACM3XM_07915 [Mycobacterium leprae]